LAAPLSWLTDALERRHLLAQQGVHLIISVNAWGVSIWAEGVEGYARSWPSIEAATTNPLIPTIETVCTKLRRLAAT
jgi:hypothetical protein